jgi:uncharacterized protein YkwD
LRHAGSRRTVVRRLLRSLLLATLSGTLAAASPVGAPAPTPAPSDPAGELLAALNRARDEARLRPLAAEPALRRVAALRAGEAASTGDLEGDPDSIDEVNRELARAGYATHAWRQRMVQGPADAAAVVRQWRGSDEAGFAAMALGDFEGFGAALAPGVTPPLWCIFVAMPRITWERREAAPLADVDAVRAAVLAALNRERSREHLEPLALDALLERAAQAHADDMAARHYYDHESPEGRTLGGRLDDVGYRYRWAAENIAKGVFVADEVVRRWMLSRDHRHNILDRHPRYVGVGVAISEEAGEVTALWVLDFAAPA